MNNISIRQLSLYITLICFSGTIIFILLYELYPEYANQMGVKFVLALIGFLFIYGSVRYILDLFVFRRLKIIYKMIGANKMSSEQKEQSNFSSSSIAEVNEDVLKWAESTQQELNTLKSLETYRKNYVGNVSHELKTPIFSIQGYLMTLIEGGLYDEAINKSYLKKAFANTERLKNIVDDLEIITKLENQDRALEYSNFDIKNLVREVFGDIKNMAKEKRIKLSFKDASAHKYIVNADKEMIRQVLENLIVNSIKYGKFNGATKVSFYELEQQILIEVSDDGIGIEEKHHKHLFDRFYRIEASRSRKIGGSGLGLSIVKHIIEAHNKTLNVRSSINIGSTFGFTLDKISKKKD